MRDYLLKKKLTEKRISYLKKLSAIAIIIDLTTYIGFESIEYNFSDQAMNSLSIFLLKVIMKIK
jgi:hypothetical protein